MREVKEELGLDDTEQKMFESMTMFILGGTVTNWKKVNTGIPFKSVNVGEWLANHFCTGIEEAI